MLHHHITPELIADIRRCVRNVKPIILGAFRQPMTYAKKADGSLVTPVDHGVNQYLSHNLCVLIPHATVLSEESSDHRRCQQGVQWIIDPLDGTSNFVHGIAYFCVTVALVIDGTCVYGAVYDPYSDELFDALLGQGLCCNGIRVMRGDAESSGGLVSVGLAYFDPKVSNALLSAASGKYSVRYTGSMGLDLAYVAAGRLRGCCFQGVQIWDGLAGALLIQEAGGLYVTTHKNEPLFRDALIDSCVAGDYDTYALLHSAVAVRNN